MTQYGAKAYKQTSVSTAGRGQVLIMLYEAAIRYTAQAIQCIDAKDIPGKGKFIGKTHDIINELSSTLNFEIGGEIAKNLQLLYHFMIEQLIKANIENNAEPLKSVKKNLETLLEGWKTAVQEFGKKESQEKAKHG